jgi:leucyl-tRNA synthetase
MQPIESSWPEVQEKLLEVSEFELAIQINGKLRGKVFANINLEQDEIEKIARSVDNVSSNLDGKNIKKTIYIKGKIINFVI